VGVREPRGLVSTRADPRTAQAATHSGRVCVRCLGADAARFAARARAAPGGAAAVASLVAAMLTEICLHNVYSCPEILRRNGRDQAGRQPPPQATDGQG
jgi:hypothetical protein